MLKDEFDLVVYGEEEFEGGDEAGDNVAGGDLNNDGIGDIVITAESADGPENARSVGAEVYVVYGSTTIGGVLDIGDGDQDVTVYGSDQNDTVGFNIGAGDVTGDGIDDLLVSARGGDGDVNRIPEAGELHIFPGPNLPETIDLASYPGDIYLYGADPADFLGNALGVVDIDGDGAPELFVGLPGGDGAVNDPVTFRRRRGVRAGRARPSGRSRHPLGAPQAGGLRRAGGQHAGDVDDRRRHDRRRQAGDRGACGALRRSRREPPGLRHYLHPRALSGARERESGRPPPH